MLYVDEERRRMARVAVLRWGLEHVYRRFRRRVESVVLSQVMEVLQNEGVYRRRFSVLSLDSTFVKASPCAADALKKRAADDRSDKGLNTTRDKGSRDRRRFDDSGRAKTFARERRRRARRSRNSLKY